MTAALFSDPVAVHNTVVWTMFAIPLAGAAYVLCRILRDDKKRIEGRLDQFARQIELCSNEGDLVVIRDNLKRYANRHCTQEFYRHRVSNLLIAADVRQYRIVNQHTS